MSLAAPLFQELQGAEGVRRREQRPPWLRRPLNHRLFLLLGLLPPLQALQLRLQLLDLLVEASRLLIPSSKREPAGKEDMKTEVKLYIYMYIYMNLNEYTNIQTNI